jgi:hypothetical protein
MDISADRDEYQNEYQGDRKRSVTIDADRLDFFGNADKIGL